MTPPNNNAEPVVPHDVNLPAQSYNEIYVGGAGNVTVLTNGNQVVTFTAPPVGSVIELGIKRVNATGTTATLMIGKW